MKGWTSKVLKIIEEKQSQLLEVLQDGQAGDEESEQSIALGTIVSFRCRCWRTPDAEVVSSMSTEELRRVQFLLATDLSNSYPDLPASVTKNRCFIGQPADLNADAPADAECVNVLRV